MAKQLLILVTALGLAATQQRSQGSEKEYKEGNVYTYDYQSQTLSGLPIGAKLYSGFKLTAQVHFQFRSSSEVRMMLANPRLYEINDDIIKGDPTREMIPTDQYTEINGPEADRIKTQLLKPLKFKYVRGHVEDVMTESDDPEWSVNMKKGCLSLLELNFNDHNSLTQDVKLNSASKHPVILYTVMEPCVTGECETAYQLFWKQQGTSSNMQINKVRNFDRCLQKPIHIADMTNGRPCDFCDSMKTTKTMSAQSTVRYHISGAPFQYVITSVVAESQYNFAPYTETHGRMATFTNQTLFLLRIAPIKEQFPELVSPLVQKPSLQAKHPDQRSRTPMSLWTSDQKEPAIDDLLKMSMEVLKRIEVVSTDKTQEEVSALVLELKRLVSKMDKTALNKLIHSTLKSDSLTRASKTLFDMLPMIGTYEAVDVLIELIEDVPTFSATPAFMSLALMPQPNVFIVKRVISYLDRQENVMSTDPLKKRASWLCLGALGHKMVKTNIGQVEELEHQIRIITQLLEHTHDLDARKGLEQRLRQLDNMLRDMKNIFDATYQQIIQMVNKLYKEKNKDSKRLALKVMGALGYKDLFLVIRDSILTDDIPTLWRMEAILSLQKLAKTIPVQVRKLLLPVFFDREQPEELRSVSFLVFALNEPNQSELEMIAETMRDEPSVNIGSLVWSTLRELSNKTTTCASIKTIVQNMTMALRLAEKFEKGLQYSTFTFKSAFDKNMQMGNAFEQVLLYTAGQKLPTAYAVQYTAAFFGKSSDVVEFGYKGQGLDDVFYKLFGNVDKPRETGYLDRLRYFWQPQTTQDWEQNIKDIKEKLGVKPRSFEYVSGDIYMKVFGQELIYLDIPSIFSIPSTDATGKSEKPSFGHLLPDITNIRATVDQILKTQRTLLHPLWYSTVVSETGLPLDVGINLLDIFRLDGNLTVPEKQESASRKPHSLLNLHKSGLHELHGTMKVDMKYITSTVSLRGRLYTDVPLSLDLYYDSAKMKFAIKVKNMKKMLPMKLDSSVRTIIQKFPEKVARYPIPPKVKELDIVDTVDIKLYRYQYGVDMFERNITLEGQWAVRRDSESPLPPFSGKQVMKITYDPMQTKEIDAEFQYMRDSAPETESQKDDTSPRQGQQENTQKTWTPNKKHLNPPNSDLTMQQLKDRFSSDGIALPFPWRYGVMVKFADPGENPAHWLQLISLYQCSGDRLTHKLQMELLRSPKRTETKAWGILSGMTLKFPAQVVYPSDLQTVDYQQQVQIQIKQLVDKEGREADTLLDLNSLSSARVFKIIEKMLQTSDSNEIVEDVISYIQKRDEDSVVVKNFVQEQRRLKKETDDLLLQPVDSKQADKILVRVKEVLAQSKNLLDRIKTKLEASSRGKKEPEEIVMIQYVVLLQSRMEEGLKMIAQRLQPMLLSDELEQSIKEQTQKLKAVRKQEEQLIISKQIIEPENPNCISFVKALRDLKRKFVTLSGKMDEQPYKQQTSEFVDELIADTVGVKQTFDKLVLDNVNIDREVRVDIVGVILLEKQAIEDMKQKLDNELQNELKIQTDTTSSKYVENTKMEKLLSQQREQMQKEIAGVGIRLVVLINMGKLHDTVRSQFSSSDQQRIENLQKFKFLQLQTNDLMGAKQEASSQQTELAAIESLKESFKQLDELTSSIQDLVGEKLNEGDHEDKILNPVLMHSLNVMFMQLEMVEQFRKEIQEKVSIRSTIKDFSMQVYEELKEDVENLKEMLVEEILKVEKALRKDKLRQPSQTAKTFVQQQKMLIMMQGRKFELRSFSERLLHLMSDPSIRLEAKRKQLIYSFISQSEDLQKDLAEFYKNIQQSQEPEYSELPSLQSVDEDILEIQRDFVMIVQKVENSVKDKARTYTTYMQELQNLQRLNDLVLREQYKLKTLQKSKSLKSIGQQRQVPDIYGDVKIMFGFENGLMKNILIKFFGRKSLEQLLWEQDQWTPLKQSPLVRQYLGDKLSNDDSTADGYNKLKDELNTYRHLHLLCTYERTIPNELREVFWKIREYLKYRFYTDTTLFMPDATNVNNTIEITTEIKRNNRWMDMEMKCPQESVRFHNMRIPQFCQYFIMPQTERAHDHFIKYVTARKLPASCHVSQDRLKTLDGQKFLLSKPSQSCETVLAMDCSSQNNFVVTRIPEDSDSRKHLIKIVTKHQMVELVPSTPQVSVKVQGKAVDLLYSPVRSESGDETLILTRLQDGSIKVEVPELSLVVLYNIGHTEIKPSSFYWSRVCGVCGNFDGVQSNDLEGPHKVMYPRPAPFLSTYVLPSKTCDPQQLHKQHGVPEFRQQPSYIQPIQVTKIVRIQIDGLSKTCFSRTPIKKCPPSSDPQQFVSKSVAYTCLRSSSPITRRLIERIQKDGVLDMVPTAPGPTLSVTEPQACTARH